MRTCFEIESSSLSGAIIHCQGEISEQKKSFADDVRLPVETIKSRCLFCYNQEIIYSSLKDVGLNYGEYFKYDAVLG